VFWKLAVCPFSGKEHLTRWTPLIELFSITGQHRDSDLLRYVPENRSSLRKMAIEKLKINYKPQT